MAIGISAKLKLKFRNAGRNATIEKKIILVFEPLRSTREMKVWETVYHVSHSGPDSDSDRKVLMSKTKVAGL